MKKKGLFIAVALMLQPYLILFALALVFSCYQFSFSTFIMEKVFLNNGLILAGVILLYTLFCCALSIVCFIVSIRKKWDALELAEIAMKIKLIQIPAYVLIFILGVLFLISIFTFAFTFILFVLDCMFMFTTGLLVAASVIITVKNEALELKNAIWVIISQFVFCADVVAAILFYKKLKQLKAKEEIN